MSLDDLPDGFGLVPLKETRGLHRNHPRSPARRIGVYQRRLQLRGLRSYRDPERWLIEPFDPMAYQAKKVLLLVLQDCIDERRGWC